MYGWHGGPDGQDDRPADATSGLATTVVDMSLKKVIFRSGGCMGAIAPDGSEFMYFCTGKAHGMPTTYQAHELACVFSVETLKPLPLEQQFIFEGVYQHGNQYSTADKNIVMFNDGKTKVGYVVNRTTGEHATIAGGDMCDYCPDEKYFDASQPLLKLEKPVVIFTLDHEGTVSPLQHTIAVTNELSGTLNTCTVSGNPPWLSVRVEGSGNNQTLVNTVNPLLMRWLTATGLSVSTRSYFGPDR
jgi:hypothetical protein